MSNFPEGSIEALAADPEVAAALNKANNVQAESVKPSEPAAPEAKVETPAKAEPEKKVEPVAEKKVETPEKPATEEPKRTPKFSWQKEQSADEPSAEVETPAAPEAAANPTEPVIDEVTKKALERLGKLEQSPLVKGIIERIEAGEDPTEFIEKAIPIDVTKIPVSKLTESHFEKVRKTLKNELGMDGEELENEMEREREKFDSLSAYEKAEKVKSIREDFKKENEARLEQAANDPNLKAVRDLTNQRQEYARQADAEWQQMKTELVGEDFFGVELTKERIAAVAKLIEAKNNPPVLKSDGRIDVEATFDLYATKALRNELLKVTQTKAKADVQNKIVEEYHRPSDYTTSRPGGAAFRAAVKDADAAADEALSSAGFGR